jgi:hypothetical protein
LPDAAAAAESWFAKAHGLVLGGIDHAIAVGRGIDVDQVQVDLLAGHCGLTPDFANGQGAIVLPAGGAVAQVNDAGVARELDGVNLALAKLKLPSAEMVRLDPVWFSTASL